MKKKAIKIAASTAVAASAFVAVAPAQQADAATNATTLATNAQNAGTVLKWAISYEGSADFATRPFNEFNAAKKAVAAAEAAAAKLGTNEKLSLQAKLVDAKIQIVRATAYIDAITSSEKIKSLTSNLNAAIATGDLGKVETAYHAASFEYKKQAKLLDRVYGQSTRDGIRNAVKPAMEAALEAVKYDVTVKMHIDKASALIKEGKLEEAAAELAKADYNLTLKDAKFTFKTQLQKSFDDAAVSLPLQAISAVGDGANTVTVKFSKAYTLDKNLTTLEAGQFKINGLTVQSAKLSEDKKSVVLTTSNQSPNTEYTVTWQGKSVSFKTAAVADTTGIAVNQTAVAFKETTESHTYTATLTNTDGTPYVGAVEIKLFDGKPNAAKTNTHGTAVVTAVNGVKNSTNTVSGVTDLKGNLVFTVAPSVDGGASVTKVTPVITKKDGDKTSKTVSAVHFFELQDTNKDFTGLIVDEDLYVDKTNDYLYAGGVKLKWDANDTFLIEGQVATQAQFETALSNSDRLSVDYKAKVEGSTSWNITSDFTVGDEVTFTNPAAEEVTYDGFNYNLSGTAEPGYSVKVYRYNGTSGVLVGTTTADSAGKWTLNAVNLTQNVENRFYADQHPVGKPNQFEGTSGVVSIYEGAFASTGIALGDATNDGVSIGDSLTFSFLNNEKVGYNHVFKDGLTGTITVNDGKGYTAKLHVEETKDSVGSNVLKIVNITDSNTLFGHNSSSITVLSTTGLVNQDELTFNVAASTVKTFSIVPSIGSLTGVVSALNTGAIVVDGKSYAIKDTTVLVKKDGTTLLGGIAISGYTALNGAQVTISGDVITEVKTASEVVTEDVAGFKSAHATTLALTTATVAVTDEVAVNNAITAYNKLSAGAKTALSAENTLLGNLKAKVESLKAAAADQTLVNAELAKVNASLELPSTATANTATIKAAVESKVDLNKVNVGVAQVAATNEWTVTVTSKATSASTANKVITVTVALSAEQVLVNAELAKVSSSLVLPGPTANNTTVQAFVEGKVDLNKVTVSVAANATTPTNFDITLASKTTPATTAVKSNVVVTVTP